MNNNIVNVELSLIGNDYVSELRRKIYKEELNEINEKYPLLENEIDIRKSFFAKNDKILEVGFFIRNSLKSSISLENIALVIQDGNGKSILSKIFDLKEHGIIPALSGKPFVVNFEINDSISINDGEEYTIKFDDSNEFKAFSSVETDIENMPIDISFEEEQEIKNFVKNLETLKKDQIGISLYKLSYTKNQGLDCLLLIRNGYDREISFGKLPITIIDVDGAEVARGVFENSEALLKISANKSIYSKFSFFPNDVVIKNADLSKCRIECK